MTKLEERIIDLADEVLGSVGEVNMALETLRYDPEEATEEDAKRLKKMVNLMNKVEELANEIEG